MFLSVTGGIFDGDAHETVNEMVFKYAISSMNNPRDRSATKMKPGEV